MKTNSGLDPIRHGKPSKKKYEDNPTGTASRAGATSEGFRPEIQALRAIAVMAVVVYHVWPSRLPGGFVGVDVFFVISGFLITSHLLRESSMTGGISLSRFWARRIRRLLPASLVVLTFCLIATFAWVPLAKWSQNLLEIAASAAYFQNWVLATGAVDYFAQENSPTLVQHFWSLSLEEQFYIFWPILLIIVLGISRSHGARRGLGFGISETSRVRATAIASSLAVVGVASLAISLGMSFSLENGAAYFATPSRVWEFVVGAMLCFVPKAVDGGNVLGEIARSLLAWAGIMSIALAALTFSGDTVFPGYAALLPTLGTAAVIYAGNTSTKWSVSRLSQFKPIQYVGDISYSLYLWHWPIVVVVTQWLFGGPLGIWGIVVIGASIALAGLTNRYVEKPFRGSTNSKWSSRRAPAFAFAAIGAAAVAAVVIASTQLVLVPNERRFAEVMAAAEADGCFGATAGTDANCVDIFAPAETINPAAAVNDKVPACENASKDVASLDTCLRGDLNSVDAIALVGDSHAQMYGEALSDYASAHNMRLIEYTRGSCPGLTIDNKSTQPNEIPSRLASEPERLLECAEWTSAVMNEIATDESIKSVIFTNATIQYLDASDPTKSLLDGQKIGNTWAELSSLGKHVVALRDIPGMSFGQTAPSCLSQYEDDPRACRSVKTELITMDPMMTAAASLNVPIVDLSANFCDDSFCYPAVGGLVAYWDRAHLTRTFVGTLEPDLFRQLDSAMSVETPASNN
jgi:peptidoglycan/LPS O-acetylase OafA/YrhL